MLTLAQKRYLSDDEYGVLQEALVANPEAGDVTQAQEGFGNSDGASLDRASAAGFG